MTVESIDSVDDARLEPYRVLRDPELVRRSSLFIVEGKRAIRVLLAQPQWSVHSILATPEALEDLLDDLERVAGGAPCYRVDRALFESLGGFHFHQGCLAAGVRPVPISLGALLASSPAPRFVLGLDELSNPDNVGAVFRTAAALGVDAVALSPGCASPLYRKSIRTSMGTVLTLPFSHGPVWEDGMAALAGAGFHIVALTPDEDAQVLGDAAREASAHGRIALLVGAEGAGLGSSSRDGASVSARIPMEPGADSLNVAAATAIALYALRRLD